MLHVLKLWEYSIFVLYIYTQQGLEESQKPVDKLEPGTSLIEVYYFFF